MPTSPGAILRSCDLREVRVIDSWLVDVNVSGLVSNFVVNDVDVTVFVEAELERRHPERTQLRAMQTPDDHRRNTGRGPTIERPLGGDGGPEPGGCLSPAWYERVDDEWSFVETMRHLVFATDEVRASRGVLLDELDAVPPTRADPYLLPAGGRGGLRRRPRRGAVLRRGAGRAGRAHGGRARHRRGPHRRRGSNGSALVPPPPAIPTSPAHGRRVPAPLFGQEECDRPPDAAAGPSRSKPGPDVDGRVDRTADFTSRRNLHSVWKCRSTRPTFFGNRVSRSPRNAWPSCGRCRAGPTCTADDVVELVRADIGAISRRAVYDAVGVLADIGLLRRIQPAGSAARYEDRVGDNHHHLICRACGRMVDVDCAVGATPCLTAADDAGYDIDEAEVIYWGRCPSCRAGSRRRLSSRAATVRISHIHQRTRRDMSNEEHGTVTTSDEPSTATCPVMSAAHQAVGITANQHWWPDSLNLRVLRQNHPQADRMGEDFDYAAEFNSLDFDALANDVDALMTAVAGLVAGRLRPLRTVLHPDDVARRRHVPHRRRPWRRRHRRTALRPAQQLARQRQPRQGPPAAVADQAEVRPARSRGPTC